jgi:hypothetical protein
MRVLGLLVILGLPGLLLGIALGMVIRRWAVLGLLGASAAVAVRYGTEALGSGPGDNDPRVLWVLALLANFIAFLVGAAAGKLMSQLPHRDDPDGSSRTQSPRLPG